MLARRSLMALACRPLSTMASQTPMEDTMRSKIQSSLSPSHLEIHNDSHLHSHHKAMENSASQETHFRVVITSDSFKGLMQQKRHKIVYALFKEEMAREGGIHALQLRTRTQEEEERDKAKQGEGGAVTCKKE
ncbi:bola-like protein [Amylocarpus encephaloides]|uniref:Bola-like protein n=1 Tax=Amylocarpus encephaloides TaxID=45428 RepID=A0A9P8BYB7_9HELO|nr:bola-like protein [Amylocarpus encephaloides]